MEIRYTLVLNGAVERDLRCEVCGDRPAPHLLKAETTSDAERALCDVHAAGLDEHSWVTLEDLEKLRSGSAPESWR